jgi:hypothetical protein
MMDDANYLSDIHSFFEVWYKSQVVVIAGATGPKLDGLSERPGVIYYCVSADYQQFWATMTGLSEDVSPKATLKRVGDRSYDEPWLVAGSGKAITAHNP